MIGAALLYAVFAFVLFVAAALPLPSRFNLMAAGLACTVVAGVLGVAWLGGIHHLAGRHPPPGGPVTVGPVTVACLRPWTADDGRSGTKLYLWCPGCDTLHGVEVTGEPPRWEWDGNLEAPTVSPSILVTGGISGIRCHSFLKAGRWEFLGDCEHALVGQTVPMVALPNWVVKEAE